jgi:hypothetical protein
MEVSSALNQYDSVFFANIQKELSQAQEASEKENIYQRIETIASEVFDILEKKFGLSAGSLGTEKKDGRFDFQPAYDRFLNLAQKLTRQEKEDPQFLKVERILASICLFPPKEEKLQQEQLMTVRLSTPSLASDEDISSAPSTSSRPKPRRRRNHPRKFDRTRGDVPTSLNPFDINLITERLKVFWKMELDFMIVISLHEKEMRETISLDIEISGCFLQIINQLLAQTGEQRNFAEAKRNLEENLQTLKRNELSSYESLINQRTHVIKNGVEEKITPEKKADLLKSFDILVDQKIAEAMREFYFHPNLNLEEVQDALERRREDKLLLHDDIFESKNALNMKYDDIKNIPEYGKLMAEKKNSQKNIFLRRFGKGLRMEISIIVFKKRLRGSLIQNPKVYSPRFSLAQTMMKRNSLTKRIL